MYRVYLNVAIVNSECLNYKTATVYVVLDKALVDRNK